MMTLTSIFSLILIISLLIMAILNITAKKFLDREKMSPFECGFDPKSSSRLPFSMHFFLIAIIFLVFDVEITLLLPIIFSMKINSMIHHSFMAIFFLLILLFGLIHEWKQGALDWTM
uniref:NADH-ubiquinone oxidoreductase chain 3 n=1 Tax=Crypsis chinensis TaxID=2984370 RepID=A0A978D7U7_9CUCU|nr:NADH dehydrogenase subunit 3 [Crypsis chinensis]UYB79088.1 NADH dehydrogenase subunit 3 [Crypsis chinensis]